MLKESVLFWVMILIVDLRFLKLVFFGMLLIFIERVEVLINLKMLFIMLIGDCVVFVV